MLFCMRTTLNLDDHLIRSAKARAAQQGRTLTSLVEEALRVLLRASPTAADDYDWEPFVRGGGTVGHVDFADRDALFDLMEREQ